jgi:hypothetical protein
MLGPQPNLASHAVLTHRPAELRLDNAFTLIEGHRAKVTFTVRDHLPYPTVRPHTSR